MKRKIKMNKEESRNIREYFSSKQIVKSSKQIKNKRNTRQKNRIYIKKISNLIIMWKV